VRSKLLFSLGSAIAYGILKCVKATRSFKLGLLHGNGAY